MNKEEWKIKFVKKKEILKKKSAQKQIENFFNIFDDQENIFEKKCIRHSIENPFNKDFLWFPIPHLRLLHITGAVNIKEHLMEISYENFIASTFVQKKDQNVNPARNFPLSFSTLKLSRHGKSITESKCSAMRFYKRIAVFLCSDWKEIRVQRFSLS